MSLFCLPVRLQVFGQGRGIVSGKDFQEQIQKKMRYPNDLLTYWISNMKMQSVQMQNVWIQTFHVGHGTQISSINSVESVSQRVPAVFSRVGNNLCFVCQTRLCAWVCRPLLLMLLWEMDMTSDQHDHRNRKKVWNGRFFAACYLNTVWSYSYPVSSQKNLKSIYNIIHL